MEKEIKKKIGFVKFAGNEYAIRNDWDLETPILEFDIAGAKAEVKVVRTLDPNKFEPGLGLKVSSSTGFFGSRLFEINEFDEISKFMRQCAPQVPYFRVKLNMDIVIREPFYLDESLIEKTVDKTSENNKEDNNTLEGPPVFPG